MAYKIESAQWTIPVTGLQYTDVRPLIAGDTLEDIVEGAKSVSKAVGNEKLYERLSGDQKGLTEPLTSSQSILGDGVLFNKEDHTYSKDGKPYLSGSVFARMFEKDFPKEAVAKKVAANPEESKTVEEVLAAWDMRGETSLQYGTLIHKCIELWCKYVEYPKNEYLHDIVSDWAEMFIGMDATEVFVQDDEHQLCGVIDAINDYPDGVDLYDWKTGDIHQKIQHTLGKDFPNDRLSLYTLQLNFYKYILEQNGKKVKSLNIGWLNGEHWEKVKVDIIDIKPYLEEVWKPTK